MLLPRTLLITNGIKKPERIAMISITRLTVAIPQA
jgi:hypothetical protein